MTAYILTPSADRDLEEIHSYIKAHRPHAADELLSDIRAAIDRLAQFPRSGQVRLSLAPSDVRFWVVRAHLVIYRADTEPLEVLRVLSGYRDLVEQLTWGVSEAVEEALVLN